MVQQVDRFSGLVGSLGTKAPARLATSGNITLSGTQVIDGVTPSDDDRILVRAQTDPVQNGIYIYKSSGPWSRAPDMDGARDLLKGTQVFVSEGTVNAQTAWFLTTASPVIGTTALSFAPLTIGASSQTLTSGSWDQNAGAFATITLTSNITMAAPTMVVGSSALVVIQGGTGGYTITWNSVFDWPNGAPPLLSTAVGARDVISFLSDGTRMYGVMQPNFS